MNRELREKIKKGNEDFSYESFFGNNGLYPDYGASAVITAKQAVTIINGEDGKDNHYYTQQQICKAIWNLRDGTDASDKIWEEYKRHMDRTIRFTIMNEGETMPRKMIWIVFPQEILPGHIEQLKAYQEKYGGQVKSASNDYSKRIVQFMNMSTGKKESGEDFEGAIKYAETLPKSKENVDEYEYIIGDTVVHSVSSMENDEVER